MSEHQGGYNRSLTSNIQIKRLLTKLVQDVSEFTENQLDQIKRLTQIGTALSAEKSLDHLLEMIVDHARKFTNADAGTLYIMSDDHAAHALSCYGSAINKTPNLDRKALE